MNVHLLLSDLCTEKLALDEVFHPQSVPPGQPNRVMFSQCVAYTSTQLTGRSFIVICLRIPFVSMMNRPLWVCVCVCVNIPI